MEPGNLQSKLKLFFEKLIEPNYILNNYYADSLLNKLKSLDAEIKEIKQQPLLPDLVSNALDHTETSHVTVKVFLIRLLAIISENELHFTNIFMKKNDQMKISFSKVFEDECVPSLRVAYVELAYSLSSHSSGVAWLIESQAWKHILKLCSEKQTVFVLRQTYKFVSIFLWKLSDMEDEENLTITLDVFLEPIIKTPFREYQFVSDEIDNALVKQWEPTLHILLLILNNHKKIQKENILTKSLLKCQLNTHLYKILKLTHCEELLNQVSRITFLLAFAQLFINKPISTNEYNNEDFMAISALYFNTLQFYVRRRMVIPLIDYANSCNILWSEIWSGTGPTVEKYGRIIEIQKQLLFISLVPILSYIRKQSKQLCDYRERLRQYILNLVNISCEHTARAAFSMRDLMFETNPLVVALQTVKRLSSLRNHLNNEQANLIFQALFYVLQDYEPIDESCTFVEDTDMEDAEEKMQVMTLVVEMVYTLVKNHNINWHQSLEVICLYTLMSNILKRRNLSCKFVVASLNVIAITVKKFLPPNLSLLMESKPGNSIHEIGTLIYQKMHDINWEIRDSALEILYVVTELSFIKYTPFQRQIIENNLIVVAKTIATHDPQLYVQASAVKCLGAASRVPAIWEHLTREYPDIQDNLISLLCSNPEGIVRKEVVSVLSQMYQNQKLELGYKQTLYEHMVSTAISDFHWEVQLAALKFWRIVIQLELEAQGMLDGVFPPITFSKETRKIVNLNTIEVQKRLLKVLDELAIKGCLTVLVKLLQDDIDAEIMEKALDISTNLKDVLDKYKVQDVVRSNNNDAYSDNLSEVKEADSVEMECDRTETSNVTSDSVIEGIMKADDINLLANIYERQLKLEPEISQRQPLLRLQKHVSPNLFVSFISSKDFRLVIDEKRRWKEGIRNLSSLFDDILGIYECPEGINGLDCY